MAGVYAAVNASSPESRACSENAQSSAPLSESQLICW